MNTTTEKAKEMLKSKDINKRKLSEELDISRPTLDSRLSGKSKWKKFEIEYIDSIY